MNYFSALSTTKPLPLPLPSDSVGESALNVPHTAVGGSSEQCPIAIGSLKNDIGVAVAPKPGNRRRSSHGKTSYRLAHPPPSTRQWQRFRIRPRTLLQLQQVSNTSRPEPVIDVLPSVLFAPRLARRAPQIIQGKQGLGLDDLAIVHKQRHSPAIDDQVRLTRSFEDEYPNDSEVIAVICRSKHWTGDGQSHTTIRFSDESVWTAVALRSGAYEFVCSKGGKTESIARWVPKREKNGGGSPNIRAPRKANASEFKFSPIDTKCRRHPVIANMSRHSIDVYDRYTIPSTPEEYCHHADAQSVVSPVVDYNPVPQVYDCDKSYKTFIETDDHLRTLVTVTGIWVALCEGWSPYFRYGVKQVISNGLSEVSNRRRSDIVEILPSTREKPHHQPLGSAEGLPYRPGMMHMASHSSVPSSPSLRSPTFSPRRTFSLSTSGACYDHNAQYPFQEIDHQQSTVMLGPDNDLEYVNPGEPLGMTAVLEESARVHCEAYELPPFEANVRGRGSAQDMVSEATLISNEAGIDYTSRSGLYLNMWILHIEDSVENQINVSNKSRN
ncbi:MAG: hypothetical protein Q9207_006102 [Kuettlingeria erythrocarpa]